MVDTLKESGYKEIGRISYRDLIFWMNVLTDDKGALDIHDLCKVYLSVDIYI